MTYAMCRASSPQERIILGKDKMVEEVIIGEICLRPSSVSADDFDGRFKVV